MKFKVGDQVQRLHTTNGRFPCSEADFCVGEIGTITEIRDDGYVTVLVNGKISNGNDPENLKLVAAAATYTKKIVITADGKTTLARLYDGKTVVRTTKAECSPNDTFVFDVGAKLAMERLMDTTPPVKKHLTAGDVVRVKFDKHNNQACCHNLSDGQILKVDKVYEDGDIGVYGYCNSLKMFAYQIMLPGEYEIL